MGHKNGNNHSTKNEIKRPESWGNLGETKTASIRTQNLPKYTQIQEIHPYSHLHIIYSEAHQNTHGYNRHMEHIYLDSCSNTSTHLDTRTSETHTDSQAREREHVQKHTLHTDSLLHACVSHTPTYTHKKHIQSHIKQLQEMGTHMHTCAHIHSNQCSLSAQIRSIYK